MARLKSWSRLHVSMRSRDHLKTIPGILSLSKSNSKYTELCSSCSCSTFACLNNGLKCEVLVSDFKFTGSKENSPLNNLRLHLHYQAWNWVI